MTTTVTHDEALYVLQGMAGTMDVGDMTIARYIEQQRSAAASTQVLREAAERLCAAVEAFARYGGDPIAMRNRMFASSNELRSALAAETSGRDGGGMGDGKLTAGEREALRQWCASEETWVDVDEASIIRHYSDADDLTLRLLDEYASLERELAEVRAKLPPQDGYALGYQCAMAERNKAWRDLAELREAARELCAHWRSEGALGLGVQRRLDALAALLPAEPPKEAHLDERYQGPGGGSALMNDLAELLAAEPPEETSDGK